MNEPCLSEWCDRPVGDGYVCQTCGDKLSRALGDVPALWDELDTVLTRQARYSDPEGRGGDKALPFNLKASDMGEALRGTLNTWCRLISEERGIEITATPTAKRTAGPRETVVADKIELRCDITLLATDQCEHCRKVGQWPTST